MKQKNIRVLFVHFVKSNNLLNKPLFNQKEIPFGVSYIMSVLRQNNFQYDVIITDKNYNKKEIDKKIKEFRPKLICIYCLSSYFNHILGFCEYLKTIYSKILILLGGPHITLNPKLDMDSPYDIINIGEGEYPVLELLRQLEQNKEPTRIKNLWIKKKRHIEKNTIRDYIQDIDKIPFPEREIWQKYILNKNSEHVIFLGRGCPFNCNYCSNHKLKSISKSKYVRLRNPKYIIKEIMELLEKFKGINRICFEIETIGENKKFINLLSKELQGLNQRLTRKLEFGANLRITENLDQEYLFNRLKKANFKYLKIGIESGSEKIRRAVISRNYSNKKITEVAKSARKYNLSIQVYVMIGLPYETKNDFKETIHLLKKIKPDIIFQNIFYPYTGTEIYDICKNNNLLKKNYLNKRERYNVVINSKGFSEINIMMYFIFLQYIIQRNYKPLSYVAKQTIYRILNSLIHRKVYNSFIVSRYLFKSQR